MFNFLSRNLLWSQARLLVVGLGITFIIGCVYSKIICILTLFLFFFCLYFFRNPVRVSPSDEHAIIAPADGIIVEIQELSDGEYHLKISIFLSIMDVHVNWAPIGGLITDISYHNGEFNLAYVPKSSHTNERNEITIRCADGSSVKMVQIAGMVARRIVCWVKEGDLIAAGQQVGMIRFGSRVDLYLPSGYRINVQKKDRVYGGQTIIGYAEKLR